MRPLIVPFAWSLALVGCAGPPVDVGESQFGLKACPGPSVVHGVDVSHWDGAIDWGAAHKGGIDFAIMKATEGTNYVDPTFKTNWSGAGKNGVVPGAYHFFRPADDGVMQADYFLQTTGMPQPGDLPPTLDLEVTDNVAPATVAQRALAFLDEVKKKTGRAPILYTSPSFFTGTLGNPAGFDPYLLWVANWQVNCPNIPSPPWKDWTIWQSADNGNVAGINSAVDLDEFNGSLAELTNFVNPEAPAADLARPADLAMPPRPVDAGTAPDLAEIATDDLAQPPAADDLASNPAAADLALAGRADLAHSKAGDLAALDTTAPSPVPRGCACAMAGRPHAPSGVLVAIALLALARRLLRRKSARGATDSEVGGE